MPTRISGLRYLSGYLPLHEQIALLNVIDQQPWSDELKRRVQHYGYRYDYKKRLVDSSMYLGELPDWLRPLAERLAEDGLMEPSPDQAIINEYLPGQGIASHVDCEPCFGDTIVSLSLGSACVMTFTNLRTRKEFETVLDPGSLIVLRGAARYDWQHGIPARKTDTLHSEVIKRGRRVSVTFRQVMLDRLSTDS
ncbi:MAG: alpha-ketoglutarate-dependent dioxygenase AlkB [Anaerolineae bacterium]|nr:alpha-ketoglutarate-dependent dioxygenase AlkB [Anaerolineae bacterium]